ncbi:hypothetical protein HYC85_031428 [Camellia sinensis]|uniref:Uncharacterized protein n=1 Tax=Camellia sinensis TaxID=4442 RepID=A0A7J7FQP7_CAMSI|nr:hypothetical protein HYC85_031428 [Camellia sinensis]
MGSILLPRSPCPFFETRVLHGLKRSRMSVLGIDTSNSIRVVLMAQFEARTYRRKPPKNLRYPRRTKIPPEFGTDRFWKKPDLRNETPDSADENHMLDNYDDDIETDDDEEEKKVETTLLGNQMKLKQSHLFSGGEFLRNPENWVGKGLCHSHFPTKFGL